MGRVVVLFYLLPRLPSPFMLLGFFILSSLYHRSLAHSPESLKAYALEQFLHNVDGSFTIPLHRVQRRERFVRRHRHDRELSSPETGDTVPLETGLGTHFAWLWVGSPPQRVSVIIDTGSYRTAFVCEPCKDCGDYEQYHESSGWLESGSSTEVDTTNSPPAPTLTIAERRRHPFTI